MEFAKLILEYIKTLIWPVILVFAFFAYEDDLLNLMKSREIDAFGLKIGKRIEDISRNYETEINELKKNIQNTDDNEVLLSKIESINRNVKKELSQVQQQSIDLTHSETNELPNAASVSVRERQGFEAILNQDAERAIEEFNAAYVLRPDYHNVSEIRRLLKDRQDTLTNTNEWAKLRSVILEKYSWGMPNDIRARFKDT